MHRPRLFTHEHGAHLHRSRRAQLAVVPHARVWEELLVTLVHEQRLDRGGRERDKGGKRRFCARRAPRHLPPSANRSPSTGADIHTNSMIGTCRSRSEPYSEKAVCPSSIRSVHASSGSLSATRAPCSAGGASQTDHRRGGIDCRTDVELHGMRPACSAALAANSTTGATSVLADPLLSRSAAKRSSPPTSATPSCGASEAAAARQSGSWAEDRRKRERDRRRGTRA